ncbi:MAG: type II toxin-antitoxin system VapC family toxin [Acidobacteriota bacterium]
MTTFVVDASVAAKWVLPSSNEPLATEATELFVRFSEGKVQLAVPDLFWPEMANVLWKAVQRGRLTHGDAVGHLAWLRGQDLPSLPTKPLMSAAFAIAAAYGRSAYDAFYVALAISTGCNLITADERLANALGARFPVRWLGSIH